MLIAFSNLKYLRIWKYLEQFFCLSPFQIFKKAYLRIWKYLGQLFAHPLFKYLKKVYLRTWKYLGQFFCLSPFQIFKKAHLQIWKYLGQFFAYPLFQILKKTYLKISKYPFNTNNNNNFKGNNLHKKHYANIFRKKPLYKSLKLHNYIKKFLRHTIMKKKSLFTKYKNGKPSVKFIIKWIKINSRT